MSERGHGCWIAALLGAGAAASWSSNLLGGEIRVWPTAAVSGDAVCLADVAELRGFDVGTAQALSAVEVFSAPRAGGQLLLRAEDIRGALVESGANLRQITIFGSSRCKVSKPAAPPQKARPTKSPTNSRPPSKPTPIKTDPQRRPERPTEPSSDTLEAALRDFIAARLSDHDGRLDVRFSPTSVESLNLTNPPYKFHIRPRDENSLGLVSFEIGVSLGDEPDRIIPIIAEVALVKQVVVAKRAINRGERIEGRAVRFEERRFTDHRSIGVTDLQEIIGQQSRGLVRPGEMLTASGVAPMPLVQRGQPVTIWMRQGGFVIRATGKAQQAGTLGETIEVLRDGTRRKQDLFEAVVTGPGTVTRSDARQVALR